MDTLFWKPLTWLLYLASTVVGYVLDWSDKHQQVYKDYQSDIKWRNDCALRKNGLRTFEESMARAFELFDHPVHLDTLQSLKKSMGIWRNR